MEAVAVSDKQNKFYNRADFIAEILEMMGFDPKKQAIDYYSDFIAVLWSRRDEAKNPLRRLMDEKAIYGLERKHIRNLLKYALEKPYYLCNSNNMFFEYVLGYSIETRTELPTADEFVRAFSSKLIYLEKNNIDIMNFMEYLRSFSIKVAGGF